MSLYPQDKRAAYTGLVLGAIALLIIITGIVHLTNAHYEGKKAETAQHPA